MQATTQSYHSNVFQKTGIYVEGNTILKLETYPPQIP